MQSGTNDLEVRPEYMYDAPTRRLIQLCDMDGNELGLYDTSLTDTEIELVVQEYATAQEDYYLGDEDDEVESKEARYNYYVSLNDFVHEKDIDMRPVIVDAIIYVNI